MNERAPPTRAARFAAAHARLSTIAVTGTNGKTTTTSMIEAIVAASGEPSARLTTTGAAVRGEAVKGEDPEDEFLMTVERAVACGVRTLALETTSTALAHGLAGRFRPSIAVFTNFTEDHLEAHGSVEAYLAAKAQLFMALPPGGVAVFNRDDPASALLDEVTPTHARRLGYALGPGRHAELVGRDVRVSRDGTSIAFDDGPLASSWPDGLRTLAIGRVHASNALAAALATHAAGYPPQAIARGLASFRGVPGRFEIVRASPLVVVDYAHTPDGLEGTLATARTLARGARVHVVFGCGGRRDKGKRPTMGRIAAELADRVTVTTDNPRDEDPEAIARDVLAGIPPSASCSVEPDRARAIQAAIASAASSDVVVIAGKGHETTQDLGDRVVPFDDAEVARSAIAGGAG